MSEAPDDQPSLVIVGRIRRAHGIRGELLIEVMTESPDAIFAPGARVYAGTVHGDPSPGMPLLHVSESRPFKDGLLVRFDSLPDRTSAERWRDRFLLVPADEIEAPAEDEVFIHELVGLDVILPDGSTLGRVSAALEAGGGLLLEIRRAGDTVLMPYELEFIQEIDLEGGRLLVDPPAGMFDDDAE